MYATALSVNDRSFPGPIRKRDDRAGWSGELAERQTGEPALIINEETYTFGKLREIARRWATRLSDLRSDEPSRVGICACGETAYLGLVAAVLSGAAFVRLDPEKPAHLRAIVRRAALDAIVVDHESLTELQAALESLPHPPPLVLTDARRADVDWPVAFDADDLSIAPMIRDTVDGEATAEALRI